jgi:hypothetical protein
MDTPEKPGSTPTPAPRDERPAYEPPRILKKRAVQRVTLFSGGGPPVTGITGAPP